MKKKAETGVKYAGIRCDDCGTVNLDACYLDVKEVTCEHCGNVQKAVLLTMHTDPKLEDAIHRRNLQRMFKEVEKIA